ncbi:Transposase [hydrothermal vent metagenome]
MRFGLISNYRRSWSLIGNRTVIANQQEFVNRYLYSAIDPINGDNFHLLGFNDVNATITKKFLEALKEQYQKYHLLLVWDNAPFHKKKELHQIKDVTPIFLPSYSPELNPVERFYGEIRKSTANRIFKDIEMQKDIIEKEVIKWMKDTDKTQNLCGYDWIIDQWKSSF